MAKNDWKETTEKGRSVGYVQFRLDKSGKSLEELVAGLKTYRDFCESAVITIDEFVSYVKKLCIVDWHLFDWEYRPNHNPASENFILFEERGVYKAREIVLNGVRKVETEYADVCIKADNYADLALSKILRESLLTKFPVLRGPLFNSKVRRKAEDYSFLPEDVNTPVGDIDFKRVEDYKVPIVDVIRYYTDRERFLSEEIDVPKFSVYASKDIFFSLSDEKNPLRESSLHILLGELLAGDWESVRERSVYNIYSESGMYSGPQKDAPYFSNPRVEEIRKALFER